MKPFKYMGTELSVGDRYGDDPELDKLVDSANIEDRLKVVKIGYGLDKLATDPSEEVRNAVRDAGFRIGD